MRTAWRLAFVLTVSIACGNLARADQITSISPDTSEAAAEQDKRATEALDNLYGVIACARDHNPGVKAAFNRWKAATERIPQAKVRPDPRLDFGYYFESVETRVGPQKQRFSLTQMFPWFGTLRLKGDIAAHDARIAQQQFEAGHDRLYLEVSSAYAEYYYWARSIAITNERFELVKSAESVAQAKYRTGETEYAAVIKAQLELGRLEDRLLELDAKERPILARLNATMNRPADAPVPPPDSIPREKLALADDELIALAAQSNPALRSLDLVVEREGKSIDLAGRKVWPNLTLGIDYLNTGPAGMPGVRESGKDAIIGRVSINLPIWRGAYAAGRREAEARRRAAEYERIDQQNAIVTQMHDILFAFHDTERKIGLYRDALLPKARQASEATLRGYEAGTSSFLDVLDAQRTLLDLELSFHRAEADRLIRLAKLRMLAGGTNETQTSEPR
jgi:outer membrane protein TolC